MEAHVLNFCRDDILRKTRHWVLAKQFHVESASDMAAVSELAQEHCFHLAILCHSITPDERQQAIDLLSARRPEIQFLTLDPLNGGHEHVDGNLIFQPLEEPQALLGRVAEMLALVGKSKRITRLVYEQP